MGNACYKLPKSTVTSLNSLFWPTNCSKLKCIQLTMIYSREINPYIGEARNRRLLFSAIILVTHWSVLHTTLGLTVVFCWIATALSFKTWNPVFPKWLCTVCVLKVKILSYTVSGLVSKSVIDIKTIFASWPKIFKMRCVWITFLFQKWSSF